MHITLRGDSLQRLRLLSGLVLLAFTATHFINHALGLVSLEAMHEMQTWRKIVTRSTAGTVILASAAFLHIALALAKLASRSTLRMPAWEAAQILIALAIPFLLIPHVMFTRVAAAVFGVDDSYSYELVWLWPAYALVQSLLLVMVWAHGCIGLHYWLRLSPFYRAIARWMLVPAIALPVLALAGYMAAGQATAEIMAEGTALDDLRERSNWPDDEAIMWLVMVSERLRYGFAALLIGIFAIYGLRGLMRKLAAPRAAGEAKTPVRPSPSAEPQGIAYHDGPTIALKPGMTLLEVSRAHAIPHSAVCGGRARCGTCQVRVLEGLDRLPPPGRAEAALLKAIDAGPDIRLACQLRPSAPLTVSVLFRPERLAPIPVEFVEVKEIAAAHQRAMLAGELVDVPAANAPALQTWLTGRSTVRIALEDLAADGFEIKGARLEYLRNRPTVAIAYEKKGEAVTLFMLPMSEATSVALSGQRNGQHVLGWSDDRYAYFAVSKLELDQLERLERSFTERARDEEIRTALLTTTLNKEAQS